MRRTIAKVTFLGVVLVAGFAPRLAVAEFGSESVASCYLGLNTKFKNFGTEMSTLLTLGPDEMTFVSIEVQGADFNKPGTFNYKILSNCFPGGVGEDSGRIVIDPFVDPNLGVAPFFPPGADERECFIDLAVDGKGGKVKKFLDRIPGLDPVISIGVTTVSGRDCKEAQRSCLIDWECCSGQCHIFESEFIFSACL